MYSQLNETYIDQKNEFANEKITFESFAKKHVVTKKFIEINTIEKKMLRIY